MRWSCLLLWSWLLLICCPGGDAAAADAIHFKDGMRTVCHGRAWEENNTVFCEYDGGILSYPKADVDRIEKGPAPVRPPDEPSPALQPSLPAAPPPAVRQPSPGPDQPAAAGVLFYDPRRAQKYWSRPDRKHDTYPEAIAALAEEYERPTQWIEENMGDSNDLGTVRDTLANRRDAAPAQASGPSTAEAIGIEFYNPRRPEKYWTGPEARHKSYSEAIAALAREFGKPPDWVERFMGDSNDLEEIRASLRRALPKTE
jgi:hypothetical protein